ncbi:glutathione S-transferase-like [Rhodopseudomonas palustris BisB5]|uniref:glutathione transferase n=1 Tax=Rhodopseudomonas palustris (strain BisB5) TaxID=316057 RepID=Q136U2_RHOPS|nr:glutathione S-transferase-like [Rhodopseudomonas palustris BisB5]
MRRRRRSRGPPPTSRKIPMLTLHHLNDSRSQRILWLLEELGAPYELKRYQRDATTRLAPPELKAVHPLGKSPMITDGDRTLVESGAIVDAILRRYGAGSGLRPAESTPAFEAYQEWLHYAEGSAMLPLMLQLYTSRLKDAAAPLQPRIDSEIANHLGFVEGALKGRQFFVGDSLTGADIMMSFVAEVAGSFGRLADYPELAAWIARMHARPAFRRSVEKGGAYRMG